jgi:hypothetical protein
MLVRGFVALSSARSRLAVERNLLGAFGGEVGEGGEATVYDLPAFRLPGVSGSLLYKEYRDPTVDRGGLWTLVEKREKLTDSERWRLDELAAWPVRVVVDQGSVVGVVMPKVGSAYFENVILQGSGKQELHLNQVMNLFIADDLLRRLGRAVPSEEQRLWLCREFAGALAFYHDNLEVVFGDISPNNAAYRLGPSPSVVFIDCDGARPISHAGAQCNTPDWVPPEGKILSVASDLYKLGLFVLRSLSSGPGASNLTDPSRIGVRLDQTGTAMLARALGRDMRGRPSAREWHRYLSRLVGHPVDPPTIRHAGLDADHVLLGQPCMLRWDVDDAITVEVRHGGETHRFDGRAGTGTQPITLAETGFVQVRAINDVGSDHTIIGPVAVVSPPAQVSVPVPLPDLAWPIADVPDLPEPDLPAFPVLPTVAMPETLTAVPAGGLRWPELPSVPCPVDIVPLLLDSPELDFTGLYEGLT